MAAFLIPDAVQRLAQNVVAASKVASTSTAKVLASFKPKSDASQPSSPKKRNKSDELANLLDDEGGGLSSFVEAGSVDAMLPQNPPQSPKHKMLVVDAKPNLAVAQKAVEMTKHKLAYMQKDLIAQRAADLSNLLRQSKSLQSYVAVCNDISSELGKHPEAIEYYNRHNIIPLLLKGVLRSESSNEDRSKHMAAARRCLALMGYSFPVKGPGVSVLSLDGGGMKGLALIEVLKQLEQKIGQPLNTPGLFDYVIGCSTGGIVALLVFLLKASLDDCEKLYLDLGVQMFSRAAVVGTSQLLLTQAFYDSQLWEKILKNRMEGATFSDFAGDPTVPKVSVLSAIADGSSAALRPFLFRNYNSPNLNVAHSSPYPLLTGSAKYKLWQGCRASSAAPFYYDDFKMDNIVFMDGGLLANNPTAFAVHETSLLWPGEQTNCVVSVGTGRYAEAWLPMIPSNIENASNKANPKPKEVVSSKELGKKSLNELAKSPTLRQKIVNLVQAATDTEVTHSILAGTLPKDRYFRFNPFLTEQVNLDECRPESLAKLQADAQRYADLNDVKFSAAARILTKPRPRSRRLLDAAKIRLVASTPSISSSFDALLAKTAASKSNLKQKSHDVYGATSQKLSTTIAPVRKWMEVEKTN